MIFCRLLIFWLACRLAAAQELRWELLSPITGRHCYLGQPVQEFGPLAGNTTYHQSFIQISSRQLESLLGPATASSSALDLVQEISSPRQFVTLNRFELSPEKGWGTNDPRDSLCALPSPEVGLELNRRHDRLGYISIRQPGWSLLRNGETVGTVGKPWTLPPAPISYRRKRETVQVYPYPLADLSVSVTDGRVCQFTLVEPGYLRNP